MTGDDYADETGQEKHPFADPSVRGLGALVLLLLVVCAMSVVNAVVEAIQDAY